MNNNTQRSAEEIAEAIWKRGQMGKPCTEEICKRAIVEALSLERQKADKLRQENEALKAQVEHEKRRADDLHGRRICELEDEVEQLKEQIEGLVEALNMVGFTKYAPPDCKDCIRHREIADEALSTLPSKHLEIAKAKEALIKAAFFRTTHGCNDTCGCQLGNYPCSCGHIRLTEALRTLQQAKEKP